MAMDSSQTKTEGYMATTKTSAKSSPGKRPASPSGAAPAKAVQAKQAAKPRPAVEAKTAPKAAPKAAVSGPKVSRAKKPAGIPLEQRNHYVEMAAYYIAERRGFAPGNPLEDWVQAEAEIERLLAEGRVGR